jgi:hypothetical protein
MDDLNSGEWRGTGVKEPESEVDAGDCCYLLGCNCTVTTLTTELGA